MTGAKGQNNAAGSAVSVIRDEKSDKVGMKERKTDHKTELERARSHLVKNELDEAANICAIVLRGAPRNARARYLLGAVAQREGKFKEAAEHAWEAARLRPDLLSLQAAAGALLYSIKAYIRALALYEAAVAKDPSNLKCHLGAAAALRKLNRNEEAIAALRRAASNAPCDAQVHYKIGQHLRSTGNFNAASEAYARALELEPGHVLAAFWLPATRKAATEGDDEKGHQGLSTPDGVVATPSTAPREYIIGLYNSYAETFDSHLQGPLGYRTPTLIVDLLGDLFPARRWERCLDLGCGTGLSGEAVSTICSYIVGVDLSPAMVRRAREKRVYSRLLVGDVTDTVVGLVQESAAGRAEWEHPKTESEEGKPLKEVVEGGQASLANAALLSTMKPQMTATQAPVTAVAEVPAASCGVLILSCDVFVYIGDLRPCFRAVRDLWSTTKSGPNNSIFAFSVEACPAPEAQADLSELIDGAITDVEAGEHPGYELQGTGRYSHRRQYLESICRDVGFRVLVANNVVLRKNAGVPVNGFVFVTEVVAVAESDSVDEQ